ncbi:MAG TPA: periplasmic heavy metal sensor [Alphaproteobacteria bacterium]|nr:periplasmic heavy metal sensor [Alphaproteobacteria bacterium]
MSSRGLRIVVFISLALNVFLIGFVVARLVRPEWRSPRPPPGGPDAIVARLSSKLDGKDAATLRAAFDSDKADLTQRFAELQSARRELRTKLMAEPFDHEALAKAMADLRTRHDAFIAEVQDALLKAVDQLSPEGRRRLLSGKRK